MEINNYTTLQGYECLSSCIVNHLQCEGLNVLPIDILMTNGKLQCRYNEKNSAPNIFTGLFESSFLFLDFNNITYEIGQIEKGDKYRFIESCFMQDKKVIVCVAAQLLNYNSVYRTDDNVQHFINIIGVDAENDIIKVSDGCTPTYKDGIYENWIPGKVLFDAWEKMGARYITVNIADIIKDNFDETLRKKNFIRVMKKSNPESFMRFRNNSITELRRYQKKVDNIVDSSSLLDQGLLIQASRNLKINSIIAQKQIVLQYLEIIKVDKKIIDEYRDLIYRWNNTSIAMIKISLSKQKDDIYMLKESLKNIIKLEKRSISDIIEYFSRGDR